MFDCFLLIPDLMVLNPEKLWPETLPTFLRTKLKYPNVIGLWNMYK